MAVISCEEVVLIDAGRYMDPPFVSRLSRHRESAVRADRVYGPFLKVSLS